MKRLIDICWLLYNSGIENVEVAQSANHEFSINTLRDSAPAILAYGYHYRTKQVSTISIYATTRGLVLYLPSRMSVHLEQQWRDFLLNFYRKNRTR